MYTNPLSGIIYPSIIITGYIAHMLHEQLDVAYVMYSSLFLVGFIILFASGIIFDVHGVQWVMLACVCGSLPLYLIAEWLHEHFKCTSADSKVQTLCM